MFFEAQKFDKPLLWGNKTSKVTNMSNMFKDTEKFNQDISGWDVSNVTNMEWMFWNAKKFNSSLLWGNKTSKVERMSGMFRNAKMFNQNISDWNVSSVIDMQAMFLDASNFNQDLSNWDTDNVSDCANFSRGSKLTVAHKPTKGNCRFE